MFLLKNCNLVIILFLTITFINIAIGEGKYRCCPVNTTLVITHENNVKYECQPIEISDNNATDIHVAMKNNRRKHFESFSFIEDENDHFPSCDASKMFYKKVLSESISVPSENCADIIDNVYYIIYCKNFLDTKVEIIQFRKCCPKSYIYDLASRACIENLDILQNFHGLIENELNIFSTGPPICDLSRDDVIVEYKSNVHGLSFDNMRLMIDGVTPYGGLNSYCIERTHEDVWIAQVCQRYSICDKIPCVRKCCNFGEKLLKYDWNKDSECVSDSKMFNPEFYDLDQISEGSGEKAVKETVEGRELFNVFKLIYN